jgi:hypothetical protein
MSAVDYREGVILKKCEKLGIASKTRNNQTLKKEVNVGSGHKK